MVLYIHKSRYMIQMAVVWVNCNSSRPRRSPFPASKKPNSSIFVSALLSRGLKNSERTSPVSPLWRMASEREPRGGHSPQVCGGSCPAGRTGRPPGRPASARRRQRTAGLATGPPWASVGWRSALRSASGAADLFVAAAAESDTPPPAAPDGGTR